MLLSTSWIFVISVPPRTPNTDLGGKYNNCYPQGRALMGTRALSPGSRLRAGHVGRAEAQMEEGLEVCREGDVLMVTNIGRRLVG